MGVPMGMPPQGMGGYRPPHMMGNMGGVGRMGAPVNQMMNRQMYGNRPQMFGRGGMGGHRYGNMNRHVNPHPMPANIQAPGALSNLAIGSFPHATDGQYKVNAYNAAPHEMG